MTAYEPTYFPCRERGKLRWKLSCLQHKTKNIPLLFFPISILKIDRQEDSSASKNPWFKDSSLIRTTAFDIDSFLSCPDLSASDVPSSLATTAPRHSFVFISALAMGSSYPYICFFHCACIVQLVVSTRLL